MSDVALAPRLTTSDRRVLDALPSADFNDVVGKNRQDLLTVWQVAEQLDTMNLQDVLFTLRALEHLRLAASLPSRSRKRLVWWRLPAGDKTLTGGTV